MFPDDFKERFKQATDQFIDPVAIYLSASRPNCQVFWPWPDAPENANDFPLPREDAESYLRSFLNQGYRVAIRGIDLGGNHSLQIIVWEAAEDGFEGPYWGETSGKIVLEQVWLGFSHPTP